MTADLPTDACSGLGFSLPARERDDIIANAQAKADETGVPVRAVAAWTVDGEVVAEIELGFVEPRATAGQWLVAKFPDGRSEVRFVGEGLRPGVGEPGSER